MIDKVLHSSRRTACDENIIHIDKDIERVTIFKLKEEKTISSERVKTKLIK